MADIWVYHPELDQHVQIPESAFLIHARSGWVQQDPPPSEEEPEEEDVSAVEAEPEETSEPASDEE